MQVDGLTSDVDSSEFSVIEPVFEPLRSRDLSRDRKEMRVLPPTQFLVEIA